jgi:Dissimilatory sulfite reductase (desulfoviridin), alpha and beta subunits
VTLLEAKPSSASSAPYAAWSGRVASLAGHLGEFNVTIEGLARPGSIPAADAAPARFDLILDFSEPALFAMRQPPQGYFRAPPDGPALEATLAELRDAVGEFEKPRFFAFRESICAHSRSEVTGCTACIDVCSTRAIAPDGNHVKVDPHLCMGAGRARRSARRARCRTNIRACRTAARR